MAATIDGYLLFLKPSSQATTTETQSVSNTASSSTSSAASSNDTMASSTTDTILQDGTYTGESTSTEWGDVQVQITVSSNKITAINVLAYPDSERKSVIINEQALPTYKSEALSAQSADIDQVSGATETYKGFTGSLQSAINKAESSAS